MQIINSLKQQKIIIPQKGTKKLGVDLNRDGKIQNNELITDNNKNGKIDNREILDFIVNNVRHRPTIIKFKKIVEDKNNYELLEIMNFARGRYKPLIKKRLKEITKIERQEFLKQVKVYFKKIEKLKKAKQKAIENMDQSKVWEIEYEIDNQTRITLKSDRYIYVGNKKKLFRAGSEIGLYKNMRLKYWHIGCPINIVIEGVKFKINHYTFANSVPIEYDKKGRIISGAFADGNLTIKNNTYKLIRGTFFKIDRDDEKGRATLIIIPHVNINTKHGVLYIDMKNGKIIKNMSLYNYRGYD